MNDPDKDGFGVVNLNTPHSPAQRLKPDQFEDILLNKPQCLRMGACWHKHIIDFDLTTLDISFEPRAVRLMGLFSRGRVKGSEFNSIRARIQRTEP